jgi:hypothetical protein
MPALLLPVALAALLAVLVPLAIHLARRSETQPTDFAALRWLRPKPRPRSRLRFDEWPLLVARLVLLALVALWLARPVLTDSADRTPVVAVVPGVTAGPPAPGTRAVWLAPGFPSHALPPPSTTTSVTSLVRQLDAELAPGVPLRVIVPAVLQGVDAERPRLSRPVDWRVVPGAMPAPNTVRAAMPRLSLRQPPGPDRGLRYLRAAAAAWTAPGRPASFDVSPPEAKLPDRPEVLVWLAPAPLPARVRDWIAAGGTALVAHDSETAAEASSVPWRDAVGAPVVEATPLGQGRVLRFTRPLAAGTMPLLLDADFPRQLATLLGNAPAAPTRVAARDIRPTVGAPAWPQPARDLQPWLALLIAGVLIIERWLATRRSRSAAP